MSPPFSPFNESVNEPGSIFSLNLALSTEIKKTLSGVTDVLADTNEKLVSSSPLTKVLNCPYTVAEGDLPITEIL